MAKYLITGIAGFIGSSLARQLLSVSDCEIVGIDCFTDYYSRETKERNIRDIGKSARLHFIEADLNELDLISLLDGVDGIYHQAGQPGVRKSWGSTFDSYLDDNVKATQRLLEASRSHPELKRLVYASSSSIYGDAIEYPTSERSLPSPFSPYGVTKLAAENLCSLYAANYGVPTVSLRYFTVYGPRQRPDMAFSKFITSAIAGQSISIYGDGEQVRDFTYIDDVVGANIAAMESDVLPGSIYNICGGSACTVNEVLEIIANLSANDLEIEYIDRVAGDVRQTGGTNKRAQRELNWSPKVDLAAGIATHFESIARDYR
ncbi:NAD-dependent epimerase/dehydratase family protein [Novosphingobium sp.]|jgi:nucleoside-diphosphate-sugar epimerase|uniref:NAD-dependent epimerase/dehydratase family protein n=1 Tax=Novosphingobium sp. TaxID=1874826 RepID=UPI002C75DDBE|nr:NAD-dependent epimerase/dehydratase family protein [Novosphingobium sp.]HQV05062.1 NAD-dependent epimerase/dehydratase family protein [Novosphingobium sp.]